MKPRFGFLLSSLMLVHFLAMAAFAQDAKLVELAKKEGGKVVIYGSLENDTVDAVSKALKKKTGLEVEFWRGSATKVMDRVVSEYRAGKPLSDVVLTNDAPMRIMQQEGSFAKYDSPSAKGFPKEVIDPNLGPRYRNVIIGIVYHTGVVKPADAPKSLEDLLKPQFRGKLVMPDPSQHTTTTQWLVSLQKIMGKEKAEKFVRDLAATKPLLVESLTPSGERVTTGETPISITFLKNVTIHGQRGVPLDYVRLGKFMGDGHYVALSAKASHPNAGKAFIDFFLGDESIGIMAKMGEFVNRRGFYPPLPDADKIQVVEMIEMDKKAFAEKMREYRKLFLN
ncbi:MAG: extracellular solute-binding protein [Deltaproteobacteria bacterium]|nr:extracellular solute-binding protein [Deltaproteobacteria bacterium]